MADGTIMTIAEMIDEAIGPYEINTVDFKLIHTILHILAKQLRILERRVQVRVGRHITRDLQIPSYTTISVTELKLLATRPKKKKSDDVLSASLGIVSRKPSGSGKQAVSKGATTTSTSQTLLKKEKTPKQGGRLDSSGKLHESSTSSSEGIDETSRKKRSHSRAPVIHEIDQAVSSKLEMITSLPVSKHEQVSESSEKNRRQGKSSSSKYRKGHGEISIDDQKSSQSDKSTTQTSRRPKAKSKNLEKIEERNEKVLRVIHQRADSYEEPAIEPTAMASVISSSVIENDIEHEKILVVERIPSGQRSTKSAPQVFQGDYAGRLSIVTQSEFAQLANEVKHLATRLRGIPGPGFPANEQLMLDLRQGASLTDAMAALQLAARLEAAEQALQRMAGLITEVAGSVPGGVGVLGLSPGVGGGGIGIGPGGLGGNGIGPGGISGAGIGPTGIAGTGMGPGGISGGNIRTGGISGAGIGHGGTGMGPDGISGGGMGLGGISGGGMGSTGIGLSGVEGAGLRSGGIGRAGTGPDSVGGAGIGVGGVGRTGLEDGGTGVVGIGPRGIGGIGMGPGGISGAEMGLSGTGGPGMGSGGVGGAGTGIGALFAPGVTLGMGSGGGIGSGGMDSYGVGPGGIRAVGMGPDGISGIAATGVEFGVSGSGGAAVASGGTDGAAIGWDGIGPRIGADGLANGGISGAGMYGLSSVGTVGAGSAGIGTGGAGSAGIGTGGAGSAGIGTGGAGSAGIGTGGTGSQGIRSAGGVGKGAGKELRTTIAFGAGGQGGLGKDERGPEMGFAPEVERINGQQLMDTIATLQDEFTRSFNSVSKRITEVANNALITTSSLGDKIDEVLHVNTQLQDVESLIASYADKVNKLDTDFSSQLTDFQETLTQMQFDLEVGLDGMMEALANTTGDPAAVAELNNKFTSLQFDFDSIINAQKDLHQYENKLGFDLKSLQIQVEVLKDVKCDREEVEDALKDKAGIGALNGLVTLSQFDSVRGDIEKQIGASYDKFNSQEVIWQRIIDELSKNINEKADIVQLVALRDNVNENFFKLDNKMKVISDIVGEPRSATVSRKIFRDSACISCSTPAHMDLEQRTLPQLPALPGRRPPTLGMEADPETCPKDNGDHGAICYQGAPIPHPIDARAHICKRYCGGSHTCLPKAGGAPSGLVVVSYRSCKDKQDIVTEQIRKACIPCNIPKPTDKERIDLIKDNNLFDSIEASPQEFVSNLSTFNSETPQITME